ncbi:MAG: hypothetical protein GX318_08970 [Clostridia bacterium]|mgnify:CR=1 FL=1|nr:hypothetical protein [Clostridia bacterium]
MFKGKNILGKMVFDLYFGKKLGRVRDIIFDPRSREALGIIITGKSILHVFQWIDFKNIQRMGENILVVFPGTKVSNVREIPHVKDLLKMNIKNLWGLEVITSRGRLMGILEDVYLRIPGGEFAGIQVSLGFIDDFLSGREFIVSEEVGNFGVDSVTII